MSVPAGRAALGPKGYTLPAPAFRQRADQFSRPLPSPSDVGLGVDGIDLGDDSSDDGDGDYFGAGQYF